MVSYMDKTRSLYPMKMEEIQKVALDILKFVTEICEKNGYRYCLIYGTLIGAIRHQGFIPWDDDVDIMMPRPDYELFLKWTETHKDVMGVFQVFNRACCKDYIYGITRISDSRYVIEKDDEKNCGMGIFIDIYPYDGLGNDKKIALEKLSRTRFLCDTIVDMTRKGCRLPSSLNWKGKIVSLIEFLIRKIRGVDYYYEKLDALREDNTFDDSDYVGPLIWFFTKPERVLFPRVMFDNLVRVAFEDGFFYVPGEYDALLTQEYGDYMTPPPIEKRIYHHQYRAYRKP